MRRSRPEARSCPLHCSFCVLSTPELDTPWQPRPIPQLLDEITSLIDAHGVTDVSFSDYSAFETDTYLEQFLTGVRDRGLRFTFRCDMRLATARRLRHSLPQLYAAGLRAVYVGIESLVGRQRAIYGKGYPGKAVTDLLRSHGIFVAAGFITLDPMYTPEEFRQQVLGITEHDLLDSIATRSRPCASNDTQPTSNKHENSESSANPIPMDTPTPTTAQTHDLRSFAK